MPNWVTNEVKIEGSLDALRNIEAIFRKSGPFNAIVPMPENIRDTVADNSSREVERQVSKGQEISPDGIKRMSEEIFDTMGLSSRLDTSKEKREKIDELSRKIENQIKFGLCDWYDWAISKWGTKWDIEDATARLDEDKNALYLYFLTAWSTPMEAMVALSRKFPEACITVLYADEDLGNNCGAYTIKDGALTELKTPNPLAFALKLQGLDDEEELRELYGEHPDYLEELLDALGDESASENPSFEG